MQDKIIEAKKIIEELKLMPHPEGGHFRRTYTSTFTTTEFALENRPVTTAIYYLLQGKQKSKFHRLKSDEIWFHHKGDGLFIHCIHPDGTYKKLNLGSQNNADLQIAIPANTWFAAEVANTSSYALCSCLVSPGFDFAEFELAHHFDLLRAFPQHVKIIDQFCSDL